MIAQLIILAAFVLGGIIGVRIGAWLATRQRRVTYFGGPLDGETDTLPAMYNGQRINTVRALRDDATYLYTIRGKHAVYTGSEPHHNP